MTEPAAHPITRIPRRYLQTLLQRGIAFWVLARIVVVVLAMWIASMGGVEMIRVDDALRGTNVILAIWTPTIAAAAMAVDLLRRREGFLLNNLGVTVGHAVVLGTLPSAIIESVLLWLT